MALNKVMLIGNVGNDPEIRYLDSNPQSPQGNTKVASFRLATTERYRDRNGETRENTEWHSIVAWRSNADLVEKFVHRGSQIFIEGKIRTRQWTDQTGNKRFTTEIQADNIQLLGKRPDAPQGGQPGQGTPGGYSGPNDYRGQGGYQGQGGQGNFQGGYAGQGFQGQGGQPAGPQGGYAPMGPSQPAAPAYAPQPAHPSAPVYPAPGAAPAPSDAPDDDLPF
ncbi:MAG: single-stranded DNA-binding protein [Bacteroidales bacterium]|nr:single-stranded DNA-binding protein [Bacteroidales bacterium]